MSIEIVRGNDPDGELLELQPACLGPRYAESASGQPPPEPTAAAPRQIDLTDAQREFIRLYREQFTALANTTEVRQFLIIQEMLNNFCTVVARDSAQWRPGAQYGLNEEGTALLLAQEARS